MTCTRRRPDDSSPLHRPTSYRQVFMQLETFSWGCLSNYIRHHSRDKVKPRKRNVIIILLHFAPRPGPFMQESLKSSQQPNQSCMMMLMDNNANLPRIHVTNLLKKFLKNLFISGMGRFTRVAKTSERQSVRAEFGGKTGVHKSKRKGLFEANVPRIA
jgi:hypothetical protein